MERLEDTLQTYTGSYKDGLVERNFSLTTALKPEAKGTYISTENLALLDTVVDSVYEQQGQRYVLLQTKRRHESNYENLLLVPLSQNESMEAQIFPMKQRDLAKKELENKHYRHVA